MVVCVDKNWAIGKNGKLLYHISEDMKRFKALTEFGNVIYGRKTLETFPTRLGLPNRNNILLTTDEDAHYGVTIRVAHNIMEALNYCNKDLYTFVIGGQSVYEQFLKYANKIYVTKVCDAVEGADSFFPDLDKIPQFKLSTVTKSKDENYKYKFCVYTRSNSLKAKVFQ